ncbi:phage tail protein [Allofustis seminis]|uniref:phage tail protein n=1 Tax=Allofustis seminis TaxID=166939 RepID=UPI0003827B47|nr:tape measure protein [Allofustis seminis]
MAGQSFTVEAIFKASGADQFSKSFKKAEKDVGAFYDSQGRLREANGRFMTEARKAELGLKNIGDSAQKSFSGGLKSFMSGIGQIAGAIGITKAVSVGFGMIKDSIGGAVSRFDTLNNANKVFENMGFGIKETERTIESMKKSLDGLPTSADDAIQNIQRISMANQDIESAGKLFEDLNYAILATGKGQEEVNSTVEMFSRSLQRGTMNGHEWENLMQNMGPTMNEMAKMMNMSTEELKQGLSDGTISFEEFGDALHELSVNGNGDFANLEQQARDMTDGIGTALVNMKGRIEEGIRVGFLIPIDESLKSNGLKTMGEMINSFSSGVRNSLSSLATPVENIIDLIADFGRYVGEVFSGIDTSGIEKLGQTIMPALSAGFEKFSGIVGPSIEMLVEAFAKLWEKSQPLISAIADFLTPAFEILGSLLGGIIHGIVLRIVGSFELMGIIIEYLTPVIQFLVDVFNYISPALSKIAEWIGIAIGFFGNFGKAGTSLKELMKSAWENITNIIQSSKDFIMGAIETVKTNFASLKESGNVLKAGLSAAWDFISTKISTVKETISTVIGKIKSFFGSLGSSGQGMSATLRGAWSSFANAVSSAKTRVEGIINKIKRLFSGLKDINLFSAGSAIMGGFLDGLRSMWGSVKKFVGGIGTWIKDNKGPISYDKRLLIPAGKAIMDGLDQGLSENFKNVQQTVRGMAASINNGFNQSQTIDINGRLAHTSGQIQSAISHEIGSLPKQPVVISMNMGRAEFKAFVEDITAQQNIQLSLESY